MKKRTASNGKQDVHGGNIGSTDAIPTVDILGISIHQLTRRELLQLLRERLEQELTTWLVTVNAELVVRAGDDSAVASALEKADLRVADGAGVVWAARALRDVELERLPGVEIAEELVKWAAEEGLKVYFLGAEPGVAEAAVGQLCHRYPGFVTAGCRHGYFTEMEKEDILEEIKGAEPDILLVALGAPRQELWLAEHQGELSVPVAVGVGGTFDVWAGRVKRAPAWMGDAGLEWLFRLIVQPWRVRRMLALPRFVQRVIKEKYTGRRSEK
ncbi:MAG: WecB/TagA/CpsF family glycosyltransferase [Firmicutes bacterium]|nr:WecB/TagA/CpsF family glycosyltransferase [Bacillota bacterium]